MGFLYVFCSLFFYVYSYGSLIIESPGEVCEVFAYRPVGVGLLQVSVLCIVACKIEGELKMAISSLEQRTGMKVRMNGKPYDVYIRQQWDEYGMKKELEKQQRVSTSVQYVG